MPYPASVVAYAFIKKGMQEGVPVTQMKLQKLVYFAHGVYMALNNNDPLIKEEFEAWQFGPVVSSIYQQYRAFGSSEISYEDELLEMQSAAIEKDQKALDSIEYTWKVTKNLSAYTLSNWTHLNGSPWSNAYKPGFSHIPIDNLAISDFFKKLLESATNVRATHNNTAAA